MVTANELRIGNWIKVGGNSISTYQTYRPKQVTAEYIKAIQEENEDRGQDYSLSVFQPIPLTPEILEKAGFKKGSSVMGIIYFDISINTMDYLRIIPDDRDCICYFNDAIGLAHYMKYLHQLQNLFFCLCGKELEINFT